MQHFCDEIDGWFNFRDIYEQAIREATDGATFVEVGSWYGRSAAWMAVEIANSGKAIEFYCVDTWRGSVDTPWMGDHLKQLGGSCKHLFLENMKRGGVARIVTPLEMASVQAAMCFPDESLDFVFIDGAHDYENVRMDVRAWYPKIKLGGVIAGDDAQWPGVRIGIHETIPESEYELRNHGDNWWHRKQRRERGRWILHKQSAGPTDCMVYVPYMNNFPLLDRGVRSLRPLWAQLIVIDQSEEGLIAPWAEDISGIYRVPHRSITFTQMMNWARAEAFDCDTDLLAFVHSDAECIAEDMAPSILSFARRNLDEQVGVTFTNYDAFAVFNVAALRDIGPWDESFRWYLADNDYYHRLRLRGWRTSEFGGECIRHNPSQTLKSDPRIQADVAASWDWNVRHYQHKWGGPPGEEVFTKPYDGIP